MMSRSSKTRTKTCAPPFTEMWVKIIVWAEFKIAGSNTKDLPKNVVSISWTDCEKNSWVHKATKFLLAIMKIVISADPTENHFTRYSCSFLWALDRLIWRLVPFILTGTQATGHSSRSYFPRIAGYIWGTTRVPTRVDTVSAVCGRSIKRS